MKSIYSLVATTFLTVGLAMGASAQTSAGQDMKDAGTATKNAAKDAGNGIKKGTVKTGKAVKNGTKHVVGKGAHATEKGADKVEQKVK